MPRILPALTAALIATTALPASAAGVVIACERGPFPKVSIINGASKRFVESIEANYVISHQDARNAAEYVCADMSAVGDADKLRALTKAALAKYKRR